ncbi:hypothetical protein BOTBODRAFT_624962 [Botryobasidium botryosum FD-172 SS1]|uniref:Inosine/uridine-preferring nucleoside hydrolase domain-containing protein n=1 Tax=Botryobasidium botryosum (strain FD-172 SS1) TaxID=930990 RepID=A0A067MU52_BOTB1|nr:hypothetical protein BOTBODRAFT_624962 [Botryobasidium botryosum FD-172 SS1]
MKSARKPVWLDCDPGHDDAIAILLAVHLPDIQLLGVSTVHGNTTAECTKLNAIRLLHAFGAPGEIDVYPGAIRPLIRIPRADPEIHGIDGLGGVQGLPTPLDEAIQGRLARSKYLKAVEGIARAVRETWNEGAGEKVHLIATGPLTNIALFLSVYPELLPGIEQIYFMGGGVGVGNRSAVAEFNILCDPEAAQIVLDAPIPKIMIPLNVTHTAIFTRGLHDRLLSPFSFGSVASSDVLPPAESPLRHTLSTLLSFFAETYKSTFGFHSGPPLHDVLTLAFVSRPDLFTYTRYRVDVELGSLHTVGETVVDAWNYRKMDDSWGPTGKNCLVAESVNVPEFFELFFEAVHNCDKISPLNTGASFPSMS